MKYREIFKVDTMDNIGENWMIANFGRDDDKDIILTTNNVRCSEVGQYSNGARGDAELVAKLLNAYFNNQIKFKM